MNQILVKSRLSNDLSFLRTLAYSLIFDLLRVEKNVHEQTQVDFLGIKQRRNSSEAVGSELGVRGRTDGLRYRQFEKSTRDGVEVARAESATPIVDHEPRGVPVLLRGGNAVLSSIWIG